MDSHRTEPSTPPPSSRSRDIPATPSTPRYGTFADLPDLPRKLQAKPEAPQTPARIHRRKRPANVLETPRQTPRKRINPDILAESQEDATDAFRISVGPSRLKPTQLVPTRLEPTAEEDTHPRSESKEPFHPHMEHPPPDVPGMWYVFRGKRIFRPLPPGEKPLKPVTLFKDILEKDDPPEAPAGSLVEDPEEADTDVEYSDVEYSDGDYSE